METNRKLVQGQTVRLELDVQERDRYGRLLAYVYVGDTMVNAELVAQGYARALGRWIHEHRQRRSSARPRGGALVSPGTAYEHGHLLDEADLAGTDDAHAQAGFQAPVA
jgi:endonuclease YncB( thermonuclease family)